MYFLGLILLIASSWYGWKLISNFFDDQTKAELNKAWENSKKEAIKNNPLKKSNLERAMNTYKKERTEQGKE